MARQLTVELIGEAAKFTQSMNDASAQASTFGDKIKAAGTKMSAFVTVPIVGFLGAATKAAMDDAAAQDHLAQTLKNVGETHVNTAAAVEKFITSSMKASTFTDDELRPSFETLIRSTGEAEAAMGLLELAMDVAAGKGIPLEAATLAVTKASEGQFAAVNKLVPGLLDLTDKTLTAESATAKLAEMFSGQAAAATETMAGKAAMVKRDMGELTESLGAKLLPIMGKVTESISGVVEKLLAMPEPTQNIVLIGAVALAALGPVIKLAEGIGKVKAAIVAANAALNGSLLAKLVGGAAAVGGIGLGNLAADKLGLPEMKGGAGAFKPLDDAYNAVNKFLGNLVPFHSGGVVSGSPGSQVPIMAMAGERIIPAGGGGGTTVVINVAGSVLTDRQLVDVVHDGLLGKQRRSGNLGIVGA